MEINLSFLNIEGQTLLTILWIVGGILIFFILALVFKIFLQWFWLPARQKKYLASVDFMLLAIDIPKNNEQSPKAVEHIFSTLSGVLSGQNLYEKYWLGVHQLSLSMELVSLEGYIQFLVYLPVKYRDVVEAAFYAQYPDAEINEVEDYTSLIPDSYPSDDFDLWGTDFKLGEKDAYPIRTYPKFEHSLSQEFKDPMASMLEVISRLGKGEYLWLQWVITPVNNDWKKESMREVKKIIGEKVEENKDFGYYLTTPFLSFMKWLGDVLVIQSQGGADVGSGGKREEPLNKILYLTAGEKEVVQGIEEKMSKIGFLTKGRMIYAARKEIFDKNRTVNPLIGALNQFNTLNMNYFTKVKTTTTSVDYIMVARRLAKRQNRILRAYKQRNGDKSFGSRPFILNIEELATIYHFPSLTVKAPMVKTAESKKSEPPARLPVDSLSPVIDLPEVVAPDEQEALVSSTAEADKAEAPRVAVPSHVELENDTIKTDIKKSMLDSRSESAINQASTGDIQVIVPDDNNDENDIVASDKEVDNKVKGAPPPNLPV